MAREAGCQRLNSRLGGEMASTVAIDIGGTGLKMMVLGEDGAPKGERVRVPTPRPADPGAVLGALASLAGTQSGFDRISVGFPGVVKDGVVYNAPNLDGDWADVQLAEALAELLGKPTRVCNDADVQGYGAVEGRGVELVITLGTGVGSALFFNGRLVPNVELGHQPFRGDKTYEEVLGIAGLESSGKRKWNVRLREAIGRWSALFNYRMLYLGGGNAKKMKGELPPDVRTVDNRAGLLGGIALWERA